MIVNKQIKINGTDYTSFFCKSGYSVGVEYREGRNGGMMLDGSKTDDIVAEKKVLSLPLMPLTELQIKSLHDEFSMENYPTVYFFDPYINGYRTAHFLKPRGVSSKFFGFGTNEVAYWNCGNVTLTER